MKRKRWADIIATARSIMKGALAIFALLIVSEVARAQLSPLLVFVDVRGAPVAESKSSIMGRFRQSSDCVAKAAAPTTVRDALGPLALRIVLEQYDERTWSSPDVIVDYVNRLAVAVPEGGRLSRLPPFSEIAIAEASGSVEFNGHDARPVEFGSGYVHLIDDDGCEWWGRYLGADKAKWTVRRPLPD